jgi:PiT family inorganic phosphate transporter
LFRNSRLKGGLLLAYANGANDNFKGVATLLGSRTTDYRRALLWATLTTALGSLTALILSRELLRAFTGKGLVPPAVVGDPVFPAAVALAAGLTVLLYPPLRLLRRSLGVTRETCVCVGEKIIGVVPGVPGAEHALRAVSLPVLAGGDETTCRVRYRGAFLGLRARPVLDTLHYLSAGAALVGVGVVIAAGGLISARRVAETMSHRVTEMNPGQGFVANFVTAGLVIGATRLGLPVSTTHVSCGSLFGIGAVTRQARWKTIGTILLAWAITLPLAGVLGAVFALALRAAV